MRLIIAFGLAIILASIASADCDWTGQYNIFQYDGESHHGPIIFLDLTQKANKITGTADIQTDNGHYYSELDQGYSQTIGETHLPGMIFRLSNSPWEEKLSKNKDVTVYLNSPSLENCDKLEGYWRDNQGGFTHITLKGERVSKASTTPTPKVPITQDKGMPPQKLKEILTREGWKPGSCPYSTWEISELKPGTVIFWGQGADTIAHATLALGNNKQIEMPKPVSKITPAGIPPSNEKPYYCSEVLIPPDDISVSGDDKKIEGWTGIERLQDNTNDPNAWNCYGFVANAVFDIAYRVSKGTGGWMTYTSLNGYDIYNTPGGTASTEPSYGPPGGTASTGPIATTPNGNIYRKSGTSSSYNKGSLLAGPISIPANRNTPTDILYLDTGKPYIILGEGVCSLWSDKTDGVDSCFCYAEWRCPGKPQAWGQLELTNPSVHLVDIIEKDSEGNPVYNPSHIYEAIVTGEGKMLQAQVSEGGGFDDNNGELNISVYEAIPT